MREALLSLGSPGRLWGMVGSGARQEAKLPQYADLSLFLERSHPDPGRAHAHVNPLVFLEAFDLKLRCKFS